MKPGIVSAADAAYFSMFQGLVHSIEACRPASADVAFGVRVGRRALQNGLLCRFDPNWIAFGPPLVSTSEQIDEMAAILERSMAEVLRDLRIAT